MKKVLISCLLATAGAFQAMAGTATVNLDNFQPADADGIPLNPIFYYAPGTVGPGDMWVEVLGSASWLDLAPLSAPIKALPSDLTGDGKDDGYLFQGGTGEFPPNITGGSEVYLQVRVWVGGEQYDTASIYRASSTIWIQKSGDWDKTIQPLPVPPDVPLLIPGSILPPIPEASVARLCLFGAAALLLYRRCSIMGD